MYIEGIPAELTNFCILLVIVVIVYFAWRSTETRDPSIGVLIIENNNGRQYSSPFTAPQARSRRSDSQLSNRTESEEVDVVNDLENEITDFMSDQDLTLPHDTVPAAPELVPAGDEEQQIIRQMDAPADGSELQEQAAGSTGEDNSSEGSGTVNEVKDTQLRHRKVANTEVTEASDDNTAPSTTKYTGAIKKVRPVSIADEEGAENAAQTVKVAEQELTIKLKYLNDELKIATAPVSETIGEFKRRNFTTELAAQKIVRLVFNGHVLQPDRKTLAECGLFDNCVVHCLIHNQKSNNNNHANANLGSSTTGSFRHSLSGSSLGATGLAASTSGLGNNNGGNAGNGSGLGLDGSIPSDSFLNRPEHGRWYLYISLVFISLTLLFCWFCRLQYAYLFSFYSTVGLVLMSILFVAMIPLIILIERDVVG